MKRIAGFIVVLLLAAACIPLQAGTAGKVKKLFKARPKENGRLYFIRDFDYKVPHAKNTAFKCDFTYNYSSLRDNDSIVMNFTVELPASLVKLQKVSLISGADTVFSNDYTVRFYTEPEGDHWKNRHSVILSRKGFYQFLSNAPHAAMLIQFDGQRIFVKPPKKYARAYQAISTIMKVETNFSLQ